MVANFIPVLILSDYASMWANIRTLSREVLIGSHRPLPPEGGVPQYSTPCRWWSLTEIPPGTAHPRGSWYRGHRSESKRVRVASQGLAQRGDAHQVSSWREGEGGRGGEGREMEREGGEGRKLHRGVHHLSKSIYKPDTLAIAGCAHQ